jgi:hypothetical protein
VKLLTAYYKLVDCTGRGIYHGPIEARFTPTSFLEYMSHDSPPHLLPYKIYRKDCLGGYVEIPSEAADRPPDRS